MPYDFNDYLQSEYNRVVDEWARRQAAEDDHAWLYERPGILARMWRWIRGRA